MVALVLASGAGLLAFALVDLWAAVRDADEEARREARRGAERVAVELRGLLRSAAFLDALPEVGRFELVAGEVEVPAEVGWLHTPPPSYSESRLPIRAGVRLQQARQAEIVDGDPARARVLLAEAMEAPDLSERDRLHLILEAAWSAFRNRGSTAVDLWRQAGASPALDPVAAASVWRLGRALDLGQGKGAEVAPVDAVLRDRWQTLAATGPDREWLGLDAAALDRAAEIDLRRRVLAAVDRSGELVHGAPLPALPGTDEGTDGTVILTGFLTAAEAGEAAGPRPGAVVANPALRRWLGGDPPAVPTAWDRWRAAPPESWDPAWAGQLVDGAAGEGSVPVLGSLAVQPQVAPASVWTHPILLVAALLLTALCFGSGLWFSFRALIRESAAMRSRADFLTSVTHELRTPLSSIRLLSEMLEEGRVPDEARKGEYYRLLAGESARLTALIENVLDLGRMDRGERAYDLRPVVVDEVVAAAAKVFDPLAARDGMTLGLDLKAPGRQGSLDRGALVQALLNVMDNSRKYAGGGGAIEIASTAEAARYRLTLRDFGPGIPAGEQEAVFARFARGAAQADGSIAGVGLGLHIARTILRAHGGDLTCRQATGAEGAEFLFTLPLAEEAG